VRLLGLLIEINPGDEVTLAKLPEDLYLRDLEKLPHRFEESLRVARSGDLTRDQVSPDLS
jgi:hypothetical protein